MFKEKQAGYYLFEKFIIERYEARISCRGSSSSEGLSHAHTPSPVRLHISLCPSLFMTLFSVISANLGAAMRKLLYIYT